MILLHRQREAGARIGADSPAEDVVEEVVVVVVAVVLPDTPPPEVARVLVSPPPCPPALGPDPDPEGAATFLSSSCEGVESEGAELEGSCGRVGVDALDCKSALTIIT